jgi:hypothetical protein
MPGAIALIEPRRALRTKRTEIDALPGLDGEIIDGDAVFSQVALNFTPLSSDPARMKAAARLNPVHWFGASCAKNSPESLNLEIS